MAPNFKPCENGWYCAHPTQQGITAAKCHASSQTEYVYEQGADDIWLGRLSEVGFRNFLRQLHVPFIMHGGRDALPDFGLSDGPGVAMKCRSIKTGRMSPSYVVNVPATDLVHTGHDHYFFACYEYPINRLVLLGGIEREMFIDKARHVAPGEALNPSTQAGEETHSIEARLLTPPLEWLWRIYGCPSWTQAA